MHDVCAVQVHRLAFTIAPLAQDLWDSRRHAPEDAPECMVTMLVCADLGGGFAPGSVLPTLVPALCMMWLQPLIKSIVQVRLQPVSGHRCGYACPRVRFGGWGRSKLGRGEEVSLTWGASSRVAGHRSWPHAPQDCLRGRVRACKGLQCPHALQTCMHALAGVMPGTPHHMHVLACRCGDRWGSLQVRDTVHHKRFVEPLFRVFGAAPGAGAASNVAARAASLHRRNSSLRLNPAAAGMLRGSTAAAVADAVAAVPEAGAAEDGAGVLPPLAAASERDEPEGWLPEKFYYSPDGCECALQPCYSTRGGVRTIRAAAHTPAPAALLSHC